MNKKNILILGLCAFTGLFILSILFYKERTIFADIAFHVFQITKNGTFAIQNNRAGAVFTQILTLIGVKMNLPLNGIIQIYSWSFVLYYFICFLVCSLVFKMQKHAILIILLALLFVSHTFYWIQSELPQGLAFLVIVFAAFEKYHPVSGHKFSFKFLFTAAFSFLALFHPLLIFPIVYFFLFNFLSADQSKKILKEYFFYTLVFMVVLVFKSFVFKATSYEQSALGGLKNFGHLFPDYFSMPSNKDFLANCLRLYYFIPVLLIADLYFYYKHRLKKKATLLLIFFFGYLMLVNICYYRNVTVYYIENLYLPLIIILSLPFVKDVLPSYNSRVQISFVTLIIAAGLLRIFFTGSTYTTRYNWEDTLVHYNLHKKMFIDSKVVPMDTLLDTWATPYEFWLLSTSQYGTSASIFVVKDTISNFFYRLPENKTAFFTFERYPYSELIDTNYFKFRDTSRYVIITPD